MSTGGYLSPNRVARIARKGYYSPDGVARRLVKGYCSPDGVARLCWEAGGGESSGVRAYLYNDTKAPQLPEWDREKYPNGILLYNSALSTFHFRAYAENAYYFYRSEELCYGCDYPGGGKKVSWCYSNWDVENATWRDFDTGWTAFATILDKVIWSNFDMEYEDTLYMAASDPVPLYSYNGVEFPELPEWDSAKFPKCTIDYSPVWRKYYFRAFAPDAYYFYSNGKLYFGSDYSSGFLVQSIVYIIVGNYGTWSEPVETDVGNTDVTETNPIWANFDMEYEGTLYLAASDPQPVYL